MLNQVEGGDQQPTSKVEWGGITTTNAVVVQRQQRLIECQSQRGGAPTEKKLKRAALCGKAKKETQRVEVKVNNHHLGAKKKEKQPPLPCLSLEQHM